jgi:hypothetical protein
MELSLRFDTNPTFLVVNEEVVVAVDYVRHIIKDRRAEDEVEVVSGVFFNVAYCRNILGVTSAGLADPFSDEKGQQGPTDDERRKIVGLCRLLVTQERLVKQLEDELAKAKDNLRQTREVNLPDAMVSAGIRAEQLSDGAKVELKTDYKCSELREHESLVNGRLLKGKPEALKWLDNHDAGDLITYDVMMQFGRGQGDLIVKILNRVKRWKEFENFKLQEKRAVNAQRLKGWVRRQIDAGVNLPLELLGVHVLRYAEVTIEKRKAPLGDAS